MEKDARILRRMPNRTAQYGIGVFANASENDCVLCAQGVGGATDSALNVELHSLPDSGVA